MEVSAPWLVELIAAADGRGIRACGRFSIQDAYAKPHGSGARTSKARPCCRRARDHRPTGRRDAPLPTEDPYNGLRGDQLRQKIQIVRRTVAAKNYSRDERLPVQNREATGGLA